MAAEYLFIIYIIEFELETLGAGVLAGVKVTQGD